MKIFKFIFIILLYLIFIKGFLFADIIWFGKIIKVNTDLNKFKLKISSDKIIDIYYNKKTLFFLNGNRVDLYSIPKFKDIVVILYNDKKPYIAKLVEDTNSYNSSSYLDDSEIDKIDKITPYEDNKNSVKQKNIVIHRYNYYGFYPDYGILDPYYYYYFPYWWGYVTPPPPYPYVYEEIETKTETNKKDRRQNSYNKDMKQVKVLSYDGKIENVYTDFIEIKTNEGNIIKAYFDKFSKIYKYDKYKAKFFLTDKYHLVKGLKIRLTVKFFNNRFIILNILLYDS